MTLHAVVAAAIVDRAVARAARTAGTPACTRVYWDREAVLDQARSADPIVTEVAHDTADGLAVLSGCRISARGALQFAIFFRVARLWTSAESGTGDDADADGPWLRRTLRAHPNARTSAVVTRLIRRAPRSGA